MMGIKSRISRLEQRTEQGQPPPLFISFSSDPVCGWKCGNTRVLRKPGEAKEELQERVIRDYGGVLYVQLRPKDLNENEKEI